MVWDVWVCGNGMDLLSSSDVKKEEGEERGGIRVDESIRDYDMR